MGGDDSPHGTARWDSRQKRGVIPRTEMKSSGACGCFFRRVCAAKGQPVIYSNCELSTKENTRQSFFKAASTRADMLPNHSASCLVSFGSSLVLTSRVANMFTSHVAGYSLVGSDHVVKTARQPLDGGQAKICQHQMLTPT